ncbi:MAG: hypothetical protein GY926_10605 [bacterium]|nr:hypothetical protein [bacterium]
MNPKRPPAQPTALATLGGVVGGVLTGYVLGGVVATVVIPPAMNFGDGLLEGLAIVGTGSIVGGVAGGILARQSWIWAVLGFVLTVGLVGGLGVGWLATWLVIAVTVAGFLAMKNTAGRAEKNGPPNGGPLVR